jgi:hypothetical protein
MITAILIAATLSSAPVQPEPSKQVTFTEEERRQALEALQVISKTFGQQPAVQTPPQKSMADVADKALDISTKYIGQAASIIEKAAPRVWSVMVRQQYAKAFGELVGPVVLFIAFLIITVSVRKLWVLPTDSDEQGFRTFVTLVLPLFAFAIISGNFAYRLSDSIQYLINPEYYAIKDLVQLLLRPGSF